MVYLLIFLLTSSPTAGSGVTVVTFDNWDACAVAAEKVGAVEIPPLGTALTKLERDKVLPDVVAICASRSTPQAKEWGR